jgi:RND family efflux transporter MFP subunit
MRRFYSLFSIAVITILLVSCSGTGSQATPTLVPTPIAVEKPTYTVQRGNVTRTAQLNGRVTAQKQQDMFFRTDGVVKEVLVQTGDSVKSGDILAQLDNSEQFLADVATAELAYAQAKSKLEQTELDAPIKLAEAKELLENATYGLADAKFAVSIIGQPHETDDLKLEKLRTDYAIALQNLNTAQKDYDAIANYPKTDWQRSTALNSLIEMKQKCHIAEINLNWAEGKADNAEIEKIKNHLDLAQGNYDQAVAEVERWQVDSPTGDVALDKLGLADAESKLAVAKEAQAAVQLLAPFAGKVLSLGIAPGSSVKAFQIVMTFADPSELEIRAVPSADDINLLGIGQKAVVSLSAQQGKEFSAAITNLPLTVSSTTDAGTADSTVHFGLDDPKISLTIGDAANILVTIGTRENVLWLPPAAIRSFQDQDFVYVENKGVQRRVNVTLGLKSAERVEILSGLEEGQIVVGQ